MSYWFESPGIAAPALATAVGVAGAALGLWLTGAHRHARLVVPFAAGVLLGVPIFGLLPELGLELGWGPTLILFGVGYLVLLLVNRFAYPVCPTCSHDHDHKSCATELHGFAAPLMAAAVMHSFVDGWSVATAQLAVPLGLKVAVPLAIALHKVPEGVALGGILRAAVPKRTNAFAWCVFAEGTTLIGGAMGIGMAPHLGSQWIMYPLGVTAGWLFYLGYHAVHEEWKRRGAAPAFVSALGGMIGAAAILRGAEMLLR